MRHDGGAEDDAADDFGDDAGLTDEGEGVVEEAAEDDDYGRLVSVSSLYGIKHSAQFLDGRKWHAGLTK
jgi:hypothetical protein